MSSGELFQELYLDAANNSLPAGARIGPLVVSANLMPVDPATQKVVAEDMEGQLRAVFQNMDKLLAAAACGRKDVARITLFMRQVSDRTAMNKVYREWFPDEDKRPPHKYLPAELPEGVHVIGQVIAIPGTEARAIEIPGIHHNDWMSLGGISGNLLTSSRIFGTDPTTGKGNPDPAGHTAIIFENADRLLALAGGSWARMNQATVFFQGEHLRDLIMREWTKRGSDAEEGPQLNLVETDLGGQARDGVLLPRLEIVALV
jgi:enamine deaminase RidA (YjgF/YER057c/UK114 family)